MKVSFFALVLTLSLPSFADILYCKASDGGGNVPDYSPTARHEYTLKITARNEGNSLSLEDKVNLVVPGNAPVEIQRLVFEILDLEFNGNTVKFHYHDGGRDCQVIVRKTGAEKENAFARKTCGGVDTNFDYACRFNF